MDAQTRTGVHVSGVFLAKNTRNDGFPIDYAYTIATNPPASAPLHDQVARAPLALSGGASSTLPSRFQLRCKRLAVPPSRCGSKLPPARRFDVTRVARPWRLEAARGRRGRS